MFDSGHDLRRAIRLVETSLLELTQVCFSRAQRDRSENIVKLEALGVSSCHAACAQWVDG